MTVLYVEHCGSQAFVAGRGMLQAARNFNERAVAI